MFRTVLLSIIRSLNTVFTATDICHTNYVACLLASSGWSPMGFCPVRASNKAQVFLNISRIIPGYYTKRGHYRFLPHPAELIACFSPDIRHYPTYSTVYSPFTYNKNQYVCLAQNNSSHQGHILLCAPHTVATFLPLL